MKYGKLVVALTIIHLRINQKGYCLSVYSQSFLEWDLQFVPDIRLFFQLIDVWYIEKLMALSWKHYAEMLIF